MRHVRALKHDRFRRELVQIGRMNLHTSIASQRIGALLIGQKKNQVRLSVTGHEYKCALNQWSSYTATVRVESARGLAIANFVKSAISRFANVAAGQEVSASRVRCPTLSRRNVPRFGVSSSA